MGSVCSVVSFGCGGDSAGTSSNIAEAERSNNIFTQTETRTYTTVQTEADGRRATITTVSKVTRTIDRSTNSQISPDSDPDVSSTAVGTYSNEHLLIMEQVTRDIVYVATVDKKSPALFLAMAQRETHLGVGSIGDPRNIGKAEMAPDINPLQLDGNANGKYWASPTDRRSNIEKSMNLLQENSHDRGAKSLTDSLSVYNSGKFASNSRKGAGYAAEIIQKVAAIRQVTSRTQTRIF